MTDFYDHLETRDPSERRVDQVRAVATYALRAAHNRDVFLEQAEARGLASLKGHRAVGGMRASIYNAMSLEGVQALVDFMHQFEKQYVQLDFL